MMEMDIKKEQIKQERLIRLLKEKIEAKQQKELKLSNNN